MAEETWFRGEGTDNPPPKPGKSPIMDFGKGMYLSDRSDVAEVYGQIRPLKAENRRLWVVVLDRASLGNVLDLSADARWHDFMNQRPHPELRDPTTRRAYATRQQESYFTFFQQYLKQYKINIEAYDAVIGPEYTHSGKQLCILHKNDKPSKLQSRVRALFQAFVPSGSQAPAATDANPGTKPIPVRLPIIGNIKIRAGLRMAKGHVVRGGMSILLNAVWYKIREWLGMDEEDLNSAIKVIEPKIDAELANYTQKTLALLSVGRSAYGNVVLEVSTITQQHPEGENIPIIVTLASLTSVYVSDTKGFEGAGQGTIKPTSPTQQIDTYPLFLAVPLSFPQDQVDFFRRHIDLLAWYEDTLKNPVLHSSDVTRLSREKREREQWMVQSFGPFPIPAQGRGQQWNPKVNRYHIENWFDGD